MRQWAMLVAALVVAVLIKIIYIDNPTPIAAIPVPAIQEPLDGLIPVAASGDGATLVLSGLLTRDAFVLGSRRVVGSRLAGRSSDPDQFRAVLLDARGQELDTVSMWSPLTRFEWDAANEHEAMRTLDKSQVDIPIPASIDLKTVVLGWPDGKVIARLEVGKIIQEFCTRTRENPACRPR